MKKRYLAILVAVTLFGTSASSALAAGYDSAQEEEAPADEENIGEVAPDVAEENDVTGEEAAESVKPVQAETPVEETTAAQTEESVDEPTDGAADTNTAYNGTAQNGNGWWYIQNGKVNFNYTGEVKESGKICVVEDGKVISEKSAVESIGIQNVNPPVAVLIARYIL